MKKSVFMLMVSIVSILSILLSFSGCSYRSDETPLQADEKIVVDSPTTLSDNMPGFDSVMTDEALKPEDMVEYMRANIRNASVEDAASLVLRLEELQKSYLEQLTGRYFEGDSIQNKFLELFTKTGTVPAVPEDVKDSELRELLTVTEKNGFQVETAEASFFPVIDYAIYKEFNSYLPQDISAYFSIMAVESGKVPAKDASLVIGWDELVNRALSQQQFLLTYAQSQKAEEMNSLYQKYVSFLFEGLPNTPGYSHDNGTMDPGLKKALLEAAGKKGDTELENTIGEYVELLEKNSYKATDGVNEFRKKAVESLSE